jgi:hypothetical protein
VNDNAELREFIKALLEAPPSATTKAASKEALEVMLEDVSEIRILNDGDLLVTVNGDSSMSIETAWGTLNIDKAGGIFYDDNNLSFSQNAESGKFIASLNGAVFTTE